VLTVDKAHATSHCSNKQAGTQGGSLNQHIGREKGCSQMVVGAREEFCHIKELLNLYTKMRKTHQ